MKFLKSRVLIALVMLVGFAGVAEAQQCFTRVRNNREVRAEGLTEPVGTILLLCRPSATFGVPDKFTVALELSTNITNEINGSRVVTKASTVTDPTAQDFVPDYLDPGIRVVVRENSNDTNTGVYDVNGAVASEGLGNGKLSSDGETITWTVYTADDPSTTGVTEPEAGTPWATAGFSAAFSNVRVNAAALGDGKDVTANVLVGGRPVNATPLKVADVTTGLQTPVTAKSDDKCADGNIANARITVKEGFADAFKNGDSFMVNFSGVPAGVSITAPDAIAVATVNDPATSGNEIEETFRLVLETTDPETSGVDKDDMVVLSAAGNGSVRYDIVMTPIDDPDNPGTEIGRNDLMSDGALEWQHITPTFKWKKNAVNLGTVMVSASFHPVSNDAGDTFMTDGAKVPRFMDAGEAATIVTVKDCTTELFYPFVTSASGYDTGIVVSNTSDEAGSCSATYSGMGAPDAAVEIGEIMPGMQTVFLVSSHVADFAGYLTVNCGTTTGSGFAHVYDTSGLAGSHGYIAE